MAYVPATWPLPKPDVRPTSGRRCYVCDAREATIDARGVPFCALCYESIADEAKHRGNR